MKPKQSEYLMARFYARAGDLAMARLYAKQGAVNGRPLTLAQRRMLARLISKARQQYCAPSALEVTP